VEYQNRGPISLRWTSLSQPPRTFVQPPTATRFIRPIQIQYTESNSPTFPLTSPANLPTTSVPRVFLPHSLTLAMTPNPSQPSPSSPALRKTSLPVTYANLIPLPRNTGLSGKIGSVSSASARKPRFLHREILTFTPLLNQEARHVAAQHTKPGEGVRALRLCCSCMYDMYGNMYCNGANAMERGTGIRCLEIGLQNHQLRRNKGKGRGGLAG